MCFHIYSSLNLLSFWNLWIDIYHLFWKFLDPEVFKYYFVHLLFFPSETCIVGGCGIFACILLFSFWYLLLTCFTDHKSYFLLCPVSHSTYPFSHEFTFCFVFVSSRMSISYSNMYFIYKHCSFSLFLSTSCPLKDITITIVLKFLCTNTNMDSHSSFGIFYFLLSVSFLLF